MDDLRSQIQKAEALYTARKFEDAARHFAKLCALDEGVKPRWLQRLGDSLQRTGNKAGAVHAYTRAASTYASEGQALKAVALCKLILSLDPGHSETQHMLARLIARPDAFRQIPEQQSARHQDTLGVAAPGYQPIGQEMSLSPEPAFTGMDPAVSFRSDELTGPHRPTPPGFDTGAMTPMQEGLFDPSQLTPSEPTEDPARTSRDGFMNPVREATLEPKEMPKLPRRRRFQRGAARGDVSEPAIQALPPLVPLEEIKLREVIMDAAVDGAMSSESSGVYHIPLPEETAMTPRPAGLGGVDDLMKRMPRVPLLSSLDQVALRAFIEQVQLEAYYAGEKIITQGEAGDCMYILVQGEVEVTTQEQGETLSLGRLQEGSFFGEVALVTSRARMVDVEAMSDVMALSVSRKVASQLVRQHPPVLKVLLRLVRDRMTSTLSETHDLFTPFSRMERRKFMRLFKFLEAQKGANMLVQDKHSPGMYLIMAGNAEVIRDGEVLREMGPGDIFGKTSILASKPSLNTVTARSKCWLLRLDQKILRDSLMNHPKVLAALSKIDITVPIAAFKGGAEPQEQIKLI